MQVTNFGSSLACCNFCMSENKFISNCDAKSKMCVVEVGTQFILKCSASSLVILYFSGARGVTAEVGSSALHVAVARYM